MPSDLIRGLTPVRVKKTRRNERLEHDPEKWKPVFPRDKRGTRLRVDHALEPSVPIQSERRALDQSFWSDRLSLVTKTSRTPHVSSCANSDWSRAWSC